MQIQNSRTDPCEPLGAAWNPSGGWPRCSRPTSTTSFTWFRHRLSNAVAEGLNSKIQTLESAASGFHSFASYRRRILFFCGGLDMAPANSRH
jgi:hypothetical protein